MNINLLTNYCIKNNLAIDLKNNLLFDIINKQLENNNPYELLINSIKFETEGKYQLSKEFADKAKKIAQEDKIIQFGSDIMITFISVRQELTSNLENQFQLIQSQMDQFAIKKLNERDKYNFYYLSAIFYTARSTYNFYKTRYNEAIKHNLSAISSWQSINEIDGQNLVEIDQQFCYVKIGKHNLAIASSDRLLERINTQKDRLTYCHALLSRSEIFQSLGNYKITVKLLDQAYQLAKQLHNEPLIFHTSKFLANIYAKQGLYDNALLLQKKVLDYFSKTSNASFNSQILNDLGTTARLSKQYSLANYYYLQSVEQSEKLEIFDEILISYYNLMLNELTFSKSEEKLKEYKNKIDITINKVQNPQFTDFPKITEALIFLNKKRLSFRFRSMGLLKEIINNSSVYYEYKLTAIFYLIELLLDEFSFTNNEEIIEDINQTLESMLQIGSEMHSYPVLIDYYLLKAKLYKELEDYSQVATYLEEAKNIAEKSQVDEIINYIINEEQLLNEEIEVDFASLQMTQLNILQPVSDYLQDLKKGRSLFTTSVDVDPLIFMIISKGGSNLFSREFSNVFKSELSLVASFISAIITFFKEAFTNKSSIELIKIGKEKLILQPLGDLVLCYYFSGHTPKAIKQLNIMTKKIQDQPVIYKQLHGNYIENQLSELLSEMIEETFVN